MLTTILNPTKPLTRPLIRPFRPRISKVRAPIMKIARHETTHFKTGVTKTVPKLFKPTVTMKSSHSLIGGKSTTSYRPPKMTRII